MKAETMLFAVITDLSNSARGWGKDHASAKKKKSQGLD